MAFGDNNPFGGIDASIALMNLQAMGPASATNDGYLLATDWSRFNSPNLFEQDPVFTASPAYGIDSTDISNWDAAYGWGDHAGLYSSINHNHTLDSLSNVTISLNSSGEILLWNGTAWVNNTLAEAGIFKLDQTTPQSITNGTPTFAAGINASGDIQFNVGGNRKICVKPQTTANQGQSLQVIAGNGFGSPGYGGQLSLLGGESSTGSVGARVLLGGGGTGVGQADIIAGAGADVYVRGADNSTLPNGTTGGDVYLTGGSGSGAGVSGAIKIMSKVNAFVYASLDTSLIQADRTYKFPDASGTFMLTSGFVPAGTNGQVQYNNNGTFGADLDLTWANDTLTIGTTSGGNSTGYLRLANTTAGFYTELHSSDTQAANVSYTFPVNKPGTGLTGFMKSSDAGVLSWDTNIYATTSNALLLDQTTSQTIVNGQPIWNTLVASQLVATDANKKFQTLAVATYPSLTEISYVKGVTSAIQTQLGAKAPTASPTFTTQISTPAVLATANDSGAIGASGTAFSDLFLASGAVINFFAGDVTLTHSADTLTLGGATTFALGATNITMTGSLGVTGSRLTKGWFTDLEVTNSIAGSITGTAAKATNMVGGNSTTLLGAIGYQSNTDVTTLLSPNTTTTRKWLAQTGTGTNGAAPAWSSILMSEVSLLNDTWITTLDYTGNSSNLIKLSKDNIIEFGSTVGINSFFHVLNAGVNDIVNIPISNASPAATEHGVGITIAGTRLLKVGACSDGAGGLACSRLYINSDTNIPLTKYQYYAASETADTIGDERIYVSTAGYFIQYCSVAGATKGSGTWVETYRVDTNGFQNDQYDDIFPAGTWENASGGSAPDIVAHTIGGISFNLRAFDGGATEERMSNSFEILHGIDISLLNSEALKLEIHTHGYASTTGAGDVKIFFDLVYLPLNAAPIAWGTYTTLITISANQQYFHKIAGVELTKPSSGYSIGDKIRVNYRRTPSDAADTYSGDWLFEQCALHAPFNSRGSRQRYIK